MALCQELESAVERYGIGPLVEEPVRLGQAYSNEVWRIDTAAGVFALKLFPLDLTAGRRQQLLAGIEFEQLVFEQGLIPMPRPVTAPDGWLVELDTTSGKRLARCHEYVHGDVADRPLGVELIVAAGRYLGAIHAVRRPGGDTSELPPLDLHRWHRDVRASQETGIDWADRLAALTPLVEDLAADLDVLRGQHRPMQISHRDYDPKNAIIDVDGQLVIADWDYAGPVLPDVELIVGATSFADTDDQVVIFVQAYRDAGGTAVGADALAMTAETADLDWLLRNVEASVRGEHGDAYATADTLIATLSDDVVAARSWPTKVRAMLAGPESVPSRASRGRCLP